MDPVVARFRRENTPGCVFETSCSFTTFACVRLGPPRLISFSVNSAGVLCWMSALTSTSQDNLNVLLKQLAAEEGLNFWDPIVPTVNHVS